MEESLGMTAGDEAPRGAAAEVNEMYVDTRQLVRISLMTERSRGGRGAQKVARAPYSRHIKAKRRKACVITHRSATAMVRRRRPPTLILSRKKERKKSKERRTPHSCLRFPSLLADCRGCGETGRALTLTRSSFSEGPGLKL